MKALHRLFSAAVVALLLPVWLPFCLAGCDVSFSNNANLCLAINAAVDLNLPSVTICLGSGTYTSCADVDFFSGALVDLTIVGPAPPLPSSRPRFPSALPSPPSSASDIPAVYDSPVPGDVALRSRERSSLEGCSVDEPIPWAAPPVSMPTKINCNQRSFATVTGGRRLSLMSLELYNARTSGNGGILLLTASGRAVLQNLIIRDSMASSGGVAYLKDEAALDVRDLVVLRSSADEEGSGGAFFLEGSWTFLNVSGSSMSRCFAGESGGAIHAEGTVELTNSVVSECTAGGSGESGGGGGALALTGSLATLTASTVALRNNVAVKGSGGALRVNLGSATLSSLILSGNVANSSGGALHITHAPALSLSGVVAENNTCQTGDGGALFIDRALVLLLDSACFTKNYALGGQGGGLTIESISGTMTLGALSFSLNSAGYGGGLSVEGPTGSALSLEGAFFEKNFASYAGGGVFSEVNDLTLVSCDFMANTASSLSGGGVHIDSNEGMSVVGCIFEDNVATTSGGAIAIESSLAVSLDASYFTRNQALDGVGGALGFMDTWSVVVSHCDFLTNSAVNVGGSMYVRAAGLTKISATTMTFSNANRGGAAYVWSCPNVSFETVVLQHNAATVDGGAFFLRSGSSVTLSSCSLENNTAQGAGGAVYVNWAQRLTVIESDFRSNEAVKNGGALYVGAWFQGLNFSNVAAVANSVRTGMGGAFFLNVGGGLALFSEVQMEDNSAITAGAVYLDSDSPVFVNASAFVMNSASLSGGGVLILAPNVELSLSEFTSNTGESGGGLLVLSAGLVRGSDCAFVLNAGGGAFIAADVFYSSAAVEFSRTQWNGNVASEGAGLVVANLSVLLSECSFLYNGAVVRGGAAVYAVVTRNVSQVDSSAALFSLIASHITANTGTEFAAVSCQGYDVEVRDVVVDGNIVDGTIAKSLGAGLRFIRSGSVVISGLFASGNSGIRGSCLSIVTFLDADVENSTFTSSTALVGGAFLHVEEGTSFSLRQSSLVHGQVVDRGDLRLSLGGVAQLSSLALASIHGCTFSSGLAVNASALNIHRVDSCEVRGGRFYDNEGPVLTVWGGPTTLTTLFDCVFERSKGVSVLFVNGRGRAEFCTFMSNEESSSGLEASLAVQSVLNGGRLEDIGDEVAVNAKPSTTVDGCLRSIDSTVVLWSSFFAGNSLSSISCAGTSTEITVERTVFCENSDDVDSFFCDGRCNIKGSVTCRDDAHSSECPDSCNEVFHFCATGCGDEGCYGCNECTDFFIPADPCDLSPCNNHGKCTYDNEMAVCECHPSYAGQYCETFVPRGVPLEWKNEPLVDGRGWAVIIGFILGCGGLGAVVSTAIKRKQNERNMVLPGSHGQERSVTLSDIATIPGTVFE